MLKCLTPDVTDGTANAINHIYVSADGNFLVGQRCETTATADGSRTKLNNDNDLFACVNVHDVVFNDAAPRNFIVSEGKSHGATVGFIGAGTPTGAQAIVFCSADPGGNLSNKVWADRTLKVAPLAEGATITELDNTYSWSRAGRSIIKVEIKQQFWSDVLPQKWDLVRKKIKDYSYQLPPGAGVPDIIDDFNFVYGFVLAITGDGFTYRQLEDYARKLAGRVKTHEPPLHGKVVRLFPYEGYGFVAASDGREVYFHENSVLRQAFSKLEIGSEVRLVVAEREGAEGPQASTVDPIGKHHIVG